MLVEWKRKLLWLIKEGGMYGKGSFPVKLEYVSYNLRGQADSFIKVF